MNQSSTHLQNPLAAVFPWQLRETTDVQGKPQAGFLHQGIVIHDPKVTECGRFPAPASLYGLTDAQVIALVHLNAKIDEASQAAITAGTQVLQHHLDITTGDIAGDFFTGESQEQVERVFLRYALTEVARLQSEPLADEHPN
jgi:hypothetical protein